MLQLEAHGAAPTPGRIISLISAVRRSFHLILSPTYFCFVSNHLYIDPLVFYFTIQGGGDRKQGNIESTMEEDWTGNRCRNSVGLSSITNASTSLPTMRGEYCTPWTLVVVVTWSNLSMHYHVSDPYEPSNMIMGIFVKPMVDIV